MCVLAEEAAPSKECCVNSTSRCVPSFVCRSLTFSSSPMLVDPLRVLVVNHYPEADGECIPFPSFSASVSCQYPGWCLEIMDALVRTGNLSIEWIVRHVANGDTIDIGTPLGNGSFSGLLGEIMADKFDTACLFYQKSSLRSEYFQYSYPVSQITPNFIVREKKTTLESLIPNWLRPLSMDTWGAFLAVVILQMIVCVLIGYMEIRLQLREKEHLGEFAWRVVDEFFNDGFTAFRSYSGVILRVVFSVFAIGFIPEIYKALLLSALIQNSPESPINNAADVISLVQSGNYKLIASPSGWFYQEIQYSTDPFFVALRQATARNPIVSVEDSTEALKLVNEGNYILQSQEDELTVLLVDQACYTIVVDQGLPPRSTHFLWVGNNTYRPLIDNQILFNYEFIDQIYQRYLVDRQFTMHKECPEQQFHPPAPNEPLNVWSLFGQFVIAAIGMGLALAVLALELFIAMNGNRASSSSPRKTPLPFFSGV